MIHLEKFHINIHSCNTNLAFADLLGPNVHPLIGQRSIGNRSSVKMYFIEKHFYFGC